MPFLAHSIIEETVETLVERLSDSGTVPFIGVTGHNPERTQKALMAALSRRVSALITTGIIEEPVRSLLRASETTVIEMWGLLPDPVDIAIGFSHREVGRALARFVHENNYRRPHLVTAMGSRAEMRRQGFIETWKGLGGVDPTDDDVPIPSHYGYAPDLFSRLRKLPEMPDVIVTGSDIIAHGLIMQATKAGLKVPDDLAVTGFGDLMIAANVLPSITTVRIDGATIADRALEVIEDRRHGIEPTSHKIDCGFEIIKRESA